MEFETPDMMCFLRIAPFLLALPLLLGALVGAPLVAREVEQRTHLLIWTQSITRMRWLTVKLALVLGAGLVASGALLALLIWWNSPSVQIYGDSFGNRVYDTSGPVWVATTLLALALGIFAGALTRRTVAAIFLTIVLFLAIRAPVELLWRPYFETPVTVTYPIDQQNPPALSNQDWIVSQGYIDAQGNRSTDLREVCTEDETFTQCLQANGVRANYIDLSAWKPLLDVPVDRDGHLCGFLGAGAGRFGLAGAAAELTALSRACSRVRAYTV